MGNVGRKFKQIKSGQGFREFRGDLMNVGINYDEGIKKTNTSDWVSGDKSEGVKVSKTGTKKLTYSD